MSISLGNTGVTFPDNSIQASAATGFGFKNRLINGGMQIDQRNFFVVQTIVAAAALAYTADRWYGYCSGANVTGQVVAGSLQSPKRYQFTGAASVTGIRLGQRIEAKNCFDLNNGNATISVDLANSLLTTVTWTLNRATTTDDTFGSIATPTVTQVATGTFAVTSTLTRYTVTAAITAASTTGLELVLSVGAQTSGTWTIGDVQLEKGSVATAFDYRDVGRELIMCQRYYQYHNYTQLVVNTYGGSSAHFTSARLPVVLRAIPTIVFDSSVPNGGFLYNNSTSVAATFFVGNTVTVSSIPITVSASVAAGVDAGHVYVGVKLSAEL